MPVLHIVLQKVDEAQIDTFFPKYQEESSAMVGKIPGLLSVKAARNIEEFRFKAAGFNLVLLATFDNVESLRGYATHPVHVALQGLGKGIVSEKVVYDMWE